MKNIKKVFIYLLGFLILAIGVNISKQSGLGISPVSSIPYSVELVWGIELGTATYLIYSIVMLLQIVILRKDYKIKNLLQIVPTFILGTLITYTGTKYLLFWLPAPANYVFQLIYLFISIIVIGTGVTLFLVANIMPLPAEGLSAAIVQATNEKIKFGNAKSIVDTCMVLTSAVLSLTFLGELRAVREGTILAALLVGKVVGILMKKYKQPLLDWFDKGENNLESEKTVA